MHQSHLTAAALLVMLLTTMGSAAEVEEKLPFVGPPRAAPSPILLPEWTEGPVDDEAREGETSFPDLDDCFPDISDLLIVAGLGDASVKDGVVRWSGADDGAARLRDLLAQVRRACAASWEIELAVTGERETSWAAPAGRTMVADTRRETGYPSRLSVDTKAATAVWRRYLIGDFAAVRIDPAGPDRIRVRMSVHRSRIVRDHRFEDDGPGVVAPEIEFESVWLDTLLPSAGAPNTVVRLAEGRTLELAFRTGEPALPVRLETSGTTVVAPSPGRQPEELEADPDVEPIVLLPLAPRPVDSTHLRVRRPGLDVELSEGGVLIIVAGRIRPIVANREIEVAQDLTMSGIVVHDLFLGETTVVRAEDGGVRIGVARGVADDRPPRRVEHRRIDIAGDRMEAALLSDLRLKVLAAEHFYPAGTAEEVDDGTGITTVVLEVNR